MTAWIIDERNRAHVMRTRRRNPFEAFCDLMERIGEPIEVRAHGAEKEPQEVTAAWLLENCGKVTRY